MMDLSLPLTEEESVDFADTLADFVVKRGLEVPAMIFLESHKPLSFLASQSLVVTLPFIAPFFGSQNVGRLSRFLQKRENVDLVITRIEERLQEDKQSDREGN